MAKNYFKPDWKAIVQDLANPKVKNEVLKQLYEIRQKISAKQTEITIKKTEYDLLSNAVKLSALPVGATLYYSGPGSMWAKRGEKIQDGISCMTLKIEDKVCVCKYDNLSLENPRKKILQNAQKV